MRPVVFAVFLFAVIYAATLGIYDVALGGDFFLFVLELFSTGFLCKQTLGDFDTKRCDQGLGFDET